MHENWEERLALISTLAENAPNGTIGRTALMKFFYFLQTLRGVPLGYRFTLYSYGPFDSNVLADLSSAEGTGAVSSEPVLFPGGYGYLIRSGPHAESLKKAAGPFLRRYTSDIEWVLQRFGKLNSAELELTSTVIYVDQEASRKKERLSLKQISQSVNEIKPHFSVPQIMKHAQCLADEKLLKSVR
jgi:hypothetical protein